jgi:hypothetical protein
MVMSKLWNGDNAEDIRQANSIEPALNGHLQCAMCYTGRWICQHEQDTTHALNQICSNLVMGRNSHAKNFIKVPSKE